MNNETAADVVNIAGYSVLATTSTDLASRIERRMKAGQQTLLFYANTNFVVQCKPLRSRMLEPDVIVVNDGVGMDIASFLLHGHTFKSNLNGTDFTPYFLGHATQPLKVFLLGGRTKVVTAAAEHVRHVLRQDVVGICDGYAGMQDNVHLIATINASKPDVILVAMGNPLQERWILENAHQIDAKVFSGVGALFDFWAGNKPRAPRLIQQMRMEWFYRLCLEPRRLLKRYTVDIAVFLMNCIKETPRRR